MKPIKRLWQALSVVKEVHPEFVVFGPTKYSRNSWPYTSKETQIVLREHIPLEAFKSMEVGDEVNITKRESENFWRVSMWRGKSSHRVASRFLRASVIIPLSQAREAFDSMLVDWAVPGRVREFNSGNTGLRIDAGNAGVFYYLDQPGVTTSEDQRGGFISFGSNPNHPDALWEHFGKTFGDVQLTRDERFEAWEEVMMTFETELEKAGYRNLR